MEVIEINRNPNPSNPFDTGKDTIFIDDVQIIWKVNNDPTLTLESYNYSKDLLTMFDKIDYTSNKLSTKNNKGWMEIREILAQ